MKELMVASVAVRRGRVIILDKMKLLSSMILLFSHGGEIKVSLGRRWFDSRQKNRLTMQEMH